jgi:hypothetical protein
MILDTTGQSFWLCNLHGKQMLHSLFQPSVKSYSNRLINFVYRNADIWLAISFHILDAQLFLQSPPEYHRIFYVYITYVYVYPL